MRIRRIHRITLAVHDAEGAARTFEQLFDERAGINKPIAEFGVRSVDVPLGDALLQLVTPVEPDNPVRSFLARKGEGFYTIALEVDDLDGAVNELKQQGVKVSQPVEAEPGVRSAFVTAAATHGLSVQLVEIAREEGEPTIAPVTTVEDPAPEHMHPPEDDTSPPPPADAEPEPRKMIDLSVDEWSDTD